METAQGVKLQPSSARLLTLAFTPPAPRPRSQCQPLRQAPAADPEAMPDELVEQGEGMANLVLAGLVKSTARHPS